MSHLHQVLAVHVDRWRKDGYPVSEYPAVAELFEWARDPDTRLLRFLREPQFRALETYWYLRLVEGTPQVLSLYQRLFPEPPDLMAALGLATPPILRLVAGKPLDPLWERIRTDDGFVLEHRLESVRETLTLDYPSYILALAMGAGKTILIGAIFATEFAMALEYPDGPFVQNALIFAPGKTIIESLRELVAVPYDMILPPRLYRPFIASLKLTFTRDGERDIPVIRGSAFNVVVTNTEKIRIQKETVRKADLAGLLAPGREDEARAEVANLRLQAIASLPHLAIFSDEAHHTYGQSLQAELKKVRKTVDYLASNTKVVAVVNTTGTPYFQRQPLRDVVVWYGLSQGIHDNILKDVSGNILDYHFEGETARYVGHVVEDFFRHYGAVKLPDGAPAKLAIYFPQTADLEQLRPVIDTTLAGLGQSPALLLRNTSESTKGEIDAFNRLNDPAAPHRVILLVNKGTEGWNCPSLFACALARRLTTSNNFVLQAATRCLRQVPGNNVKARIYLSRENRAVLDRQLQETYGETIAELNETRRETRSARLVLRKRTPPPLVLTRVVQRAVPRQAASRPLTLTRPAPAVSSPSIIRVVLDIADRPGLRRVLQQVGEAVRIEAVPETVDHYEAAVSLAARSRLDVWPIYDELRRLYPDGNEIPESDLAELARQLAEGQAGYEVREEQAEWALALVKPEGFRKVSDASGELYIAEITYPMDKEHLLVGRQRLLRENPADFGFHYDPYNFDSGPEQDLFVQILRDLNLQPAEVEDVYFTGGLTDPAKTDFCVEYRGEDGRWHRYTPDFVIRKRPPRGGRPGSGRTLIVEVKAATHRAAVREDERRLDRGEEPVTVEGRKAVALRKLERLNPDRLKYELVFVNGVVPADAFGAIHRFVREPERAYRLDLDQAHRLKDLILQADGDRVTRIVLFGSRARGEAAPDSDFDLLVVLRDLVPSESVPYQLHLHRVLQGAGVTVEPWPMSEQEFEETKTVVGGLAYPAWTEGVVLYEKR
ncbi:MAG: nucleotidyltransferase domain-containing protein [Candidatus Rokuibacteriota bacterium]